MKVLHHNFTTEDQFLKELHLSEIPLNHPHILVQIFDGSQNFKLLSQLLKFIRKIIPNGIIFGATTDGEILNKQILEGNLLISVLYFENTRLQIEKTDNQAKTFFEEGVRLGQKLQQKDLTAAILLGEGLFMNGEDLLSGFAHQVGDIVIAGGLAADNYAFIQTHLFYQDEILDRGAVAVGLYSDTLRAATRLAFDCDTLSQEFVITESEGNIVRKIDNMTPEVFYTEQLGIPVDNQLIHICAQIPLVANRDGKNLARAAVSHYPDGALGFAGNLIEGEKIRLGIANVETMLKNGFDIYNEMNSQWDVIQIFSCTGRKPILGDKLAQDIQHFPKIAPVNGFFSYGEFIKEKGEKAHFCNQTMVLLFLSESKDTSITKPAQHKERNEDSLEELSLSKKSFQKIENEMLNQIMQEQFMLIEHKNKIKERLVLVEYKNKIMGEILYKDSLTDLKNRTSLLQQIKERPSRGVMLIDIRNFHAINDLYGESVGNQILKSFANFLRKKFTLSNIYRLSGNTFASLNIYNFSQQKVMDIAQEFVKDIQNENFCFREKEMELECAISVAIGISNEKEEKKHLEYADMALNYAKKHHRDIVIYNDSLNIKQEYENDISVVKMVKKALDEDRMIPFFQPVFEGEKISYYESLVRIIAEDGQILSPFYFLDVIKQTSYYSYLTKRMIKKSFETFQHIDSKISINLSFLDFLNTNTMEYLQEMIIKYSMGRKLILEILESEVFQDYKTTISQIDQFKSLGVEIAIDDFGSGYSNFIHLTQINPDYIKIDGSLIKNIDTDTKSLAICKAIISFAKDLGIQTIAEFIHSKEVLEVTTQLKVDKHQGFYLKKPQKIEELILKKST